MMIDVKEFVKQKFNIERELYLYNKVDDMDYVDLIQLLNEFQEQLLNKQDVSGSCETSDDNSHGDLVPLVWEIEKLRRKEGGCTMNKLITEVKKNFKGLESIKHRSINYR